MSILLRLGFCLTLFGFCLYSYLDAQNGLTQLKIKMPEIEREVRLLREENSRLGFEIDEFQSPANLIELGARPEFRHLKHPLLHEVLTVPEPIAANE